MTSLDRSQVVVSCTVAELCLTDSKMNHHNTQTHLHAVLFDPVPHLQRQTQGLGLLVKEVLEHGEVYRCVEVCERVRLEKKETTNPQ